MRSRVEELFHEVVDLPAEARVRIFAERGVDTATRREVEALLAFDTGPHTSLEREIGRVAQRAMSRVEPEELQCGPYRLTGLLGRGGMGTVHLAERVDGEVKQRVAVKILRPGADAPELRERFLAERQILATLSHPNIATLLDAGHSEDGRPYLAMEYVKGSPIDLYAAPLPLRRKIELFLKVCGAVGYLHQNLVVHRDLKPPNIVVTDRGEPKLLDFGIAKILDCSADSTVTGMRMLTPEYASPEQVSGGPISTATDVYSLGAVLYKLLTGSSPHRIEGDSPAAVALAISTGRITPPSKLAPAVKGDLELIVLKALRKEPQERYATVEKFSGDLENYLESRPIRARKGDRWYRTRKFLRRHWLSVAASALSAAALSTGTFLANRQRAVAQRRFVLVRQLANRLFDIDAEVRRTPGNTKARELIVGTSLEYLERVSAGVPPDPELALELGNAYMRVARVQGVPTALNLGHMDQASENLRIAERFIDSVLASRPANRAAMLRAAQIAHDRMLLSRLSGRNDEALALARKSAQFLERFNAGLADKPEAAAILNTYLNVADQYALGGRFDEARGLCSRASDLAGTFDNRPYLGNILWVRAKIARSRGDLDPALQSVRESVRVLEPGTGNADHGRAMNYILALIYEARILGEENAVNLERPSEALALFERAFTLADGFVHQDANDQDSRGRLAMAGLGLAGILRRSNARRSLAVYDHTLRHLAEIARNSSFRRFEVSALAGSTYPLRLLGRAPEARQRLHSAFERLLQTKDYPAASVKPGSEPDLALCALADYEAGNGNLDAAIGIYQDLLVKIEAAAPKSESSLADAVAVSRVFAALAALSLRAHRSDLASSLAARRIDLWRRWDASLPQNPFVRRQLAAATEFVEGNLAR